MQLLLQKESSNTQPECLGVTLGIQHAMHMRHFVIRGLPRRKSFFHSVCSCIVYIILVRF